MLKDTKQKESSVKQHILRHKKLYIVLTVILLGTTWLAGVPQRAVYFVGCGGKMPVRVMKDWMPGFAGGSYTAGYYLPNDRWYSSRIFTNDSYYCTAEQAEKAGWEPAFDSDEAARRENIKYEENVRKRNESRNL